VPSPTTRKRLTAEERRQEILEAALDLFAERGYHGSSIDDIARGAGVSKALIYEHFASKEELHVKLLRENADELLGRLGQAIGDLPPGQRLEPGVDAFFAFVEERREAWRMLFREAADTPVTAALDEVVAQVTEMVAGLIAEDPAAPSVDPERGQVSDAGIQMLAQLLVGSVQTLANWWAENQDVPRRQLVNVVMDFAWLGLDRLRAGERWRGSGA
jgi:AcrR family transcriptional regulator